MADVGRPTKLTEELLERAKGYLSTCTDEIHTTDKGSISYVEVKLPSIVGLASYLGIHKDTIYEWRKEKGTFSDLVKEIEQEQEIRLINKGLGGVYTSKALGAMLTKHGYREGADLTTDGEKLPTPIIPLNVQRNYSNEEDSGTDEED